MKYVVFAPGDYTPNGGGCVALHKLAHNISSLGEECYIMTSKKNPNYLGIEVDEKQAIELCRDNAIAIYPEVICGNPLGAKHVMRWILYYVREYGDHGVFGESDLIYKYAEKFTLRYPQKVHGELRAVELNLDTFINKGLSRSGSCHLYKKCHRESKPVLHPSDSIELDNYASKGGNEYLAEVFNRCEIFYAYDPATWLSVMAALCGCVSVAVPTEGVTATEFYSKFPYFRYGIAYGLDEVEYALSTISKVRPHLLKLEAETIELAKAFIAKAKEVSNETV